MNGKALSIISTSLAVSLMFGSVGINNAHASDMETDNAAMHEAARRAALQQVIMSSQDTSKAPTKDEFVTRQEPWTPTAGFVRKENEADSSQQFEVDNLPQSIAINVHTMESDTASMQPRMDFLTISGLRIEEDGKTISFSIDNHFNRTNAKPILLGGFMLTGMVRYDYDNGAEVHNTVLHKEQRVSLTPGRNLYTTTPALYPHVTKLESLQFYFMPPKSQQMNFLKSAEAESVNIPDTSISFKVSNLPEVIKIDQNTIDQNAAQRDPRLGYLTITGLKVSEDSKNIEFTIHNSFDRQLNPEPIHVGGLMVTGLAKYNYDNGAALHSSVFLEEKRVMLPKGSTFFKTDSSSYPGVNKIENLQFFLTP